MPLIRKRRSEATHEPSNDASPEATQETPRQRRRTDNSPASADSAGEFPSSDDDDDDDSASPATRTPNGEDVMVKKLVRLALASEYSRQPIRRADVSTKVLGEQGSRPFKGVFEEAQKALRTRFGMELVELPQREKLTVSQRRAAQRVEKPTTSSNKSWILSTTLPRAYRAPEIVPPNKASSSATEGSYTALYTFIVAVIMLNGGSLAEQKLERYLRRANADSYTPIDRTERLLQRLCKEGYIVRNREMDGGEEVIEYMVGPRGKAEVGPRGVGDLAREVYGFQRHRGRAADGEDVESERAEEFESRLQRSLGTGRREPVDGNDGEQMDNAGGGAQTRRSRRDADGAESEEDSED